ncbi:hypothetical protein N7523_009402 [Penicillium sp. IBT 18751x]|nr:hypothetical protein N7523_009402 [Penicillium sp. IBT 18751x]
MAARAITRAIDTMANHVCVAMIMEMAAIPSLNVLFPGLKDADQASTLSERLVDALVDVLGLQMMILVPLVEFFEGIGTVEDPQS